MRPLESLLLLALAAAACHSSQPLHSSAAAVPILDGWRPSDSVVTAVSDWPPAAFPLRVSDNRQFLVDSLGTPFPIHGDSPWAIILRLSLEEVDQYVSNRLRHGFNTVIVNLVEHLDPNNRAGEPPFHEPHDFSQPNEAYFAHADDVLRRFSQAGFLVLLVPAYLGANGGEEGFFAEMGRLTFADCRAYGRFVGSRYASLTNIVWVLGGDFTPPPWSHGALCTLAIGHGLREVDPDAHYAAHWAPETESMDQPAFAPMLTLNGVYTYRGVEDACRTARSHSEVMPAFLFETHYENAHHRPAADVRRRAYAGMLNCGAGQVFGNRPIWLFGEGWQAALDAVGSQDMTRLRELMASLPWTELEPSPSLAPPGAPLGLDGAIPSGARTRDGRLAVVYLPAWDPLVRGMLGPRQRFRLNLEGLNGPVRIELFDPSSGRLWDTPEAVALDEGAVDLVTPGPNASGDTDWLAILRVVVPAP